jgi:hypothetical protein
MHGLVTFIRLMAAFAVGVLFDLFVFRDAFAYSDRHWGGNHGIISPFWLSLALLFLCSFVLNANSRRGVSSSARTLRESLDSYGLLIPLVILLGLTAARTIVLIRDTPVGFHATFPFLPLVRRRAQRSGTVRGPKMTLLMCHIQQAGLPKVHPASELLKLDTGQES